MSDQDDLGLSVCMLDVDRLRDWARLITIHGADISHWSSPAFVSSRLEQLADSLDEAVRDIGKLRAALTAAAERKAAKDEEIARLFVDVTAAEEDRDEWKAEVDRLTAELAERKAQVIMLLAERPLHEVTADDIAWAKAALGLPSPDAPQPPLHVFAICPECKWRTRDDREPQHRSMCSKPAPTRWENQNGESVPQPPGTTRETP